MGGRTALHVALAAGNRVERLVLIGATPGLADPAERAARREADERRADHLLDVGVDAFLDEWLSAPLFAHLPRDEAAREHRRGNTVAGLAHSLRTAGTGVQAPLWDRLSEIEIPVLVLAGELDDKFTGIGRRMADQLPDATFATVPSAGHAAHSEQPEAVAGLVADWLQPD
jgi:2-succinyl-6-hydroxy-2,4-cyclohexadiene-1-carboxylate synthase